MTLLPKNIVLLMALAGLGHNAFAQQMMDKVMQEINNRQAATKAQSAAAEKAARQAQIERFKTHPEELADPHRCDPEKFKGTPQEQWWAGITCRQVSGLEAEEERGRALPYDCVDVESCHSTIQRFLAHMAVIRGKHALMSPTELDLATMMMGFPSPCAMTILACKPGLEEVNREVEVNYRRFLEKKLTEARAKFEKEKDELSNDENQEENRLRDALSASRK